ncbi:MAG TPA: rod shape-determining protein MreD [Chloroflexi bacterium]|nr:MAG: rod shape-determining protein MreD [Chloroflexota bacterium]HDD55173.1 rod shape-determining protein MreD [Chloroflexota bacterium]
MSVILSIPTLAFISILQSAVVSRLPLNQGIADLMLVLLVAIALQKKVNTAWQWSIIGGLLTDFNSGLPFGIFTASYLLATALATVLRERIWRFSFLMQLLVVLAGTLVSQVLSYLVFFLGGTSLDFVTVLRVITMPSIILNFMLSLPIFVLTRDVLDQINPQEQNA